MAFCKSLEIRRFTSGHAFLCTLPYVTLFFHLFCHTLYYLLLSLPLYFPLSLARSLVLSWNAELLAGQQQYFSIKSKIYVKKMQFKQYMCNRVFTTLQHYLYHTPLPCYPISSTFFSLATDLYIPKKSTHIEVDNWYLHFTI